jgi:hypothetical protein
VVIDERTSGFGRRLKSIVSFRAVTCVVGHTKTWRPSYTNVEMHRPFRVIDAKLAELLTRWGIETRFANGRPLQSRQGLVLAIVLGGIAGIMAWKLIGRPGYSSDFFQFWSGARTLLHGGDPYLVAPDSLLNPGHDRGLYPLPAYLLLAPIAALPLGVAGGVFMGVTSGCAAWGIARTGVERLPIFLSAPFFLALSLGQWTPLMVAAALVPALGGAIVAKPNLGLAVWVSRPSLVAVVTGILILAASLIILPRWPLEWLANIAGRAEKFVPILRPGGFLLLLSLVAARRPEGRLFTSLALIPQALFFYDQLLLWLIPRTLRQSIGLSLCSLLLFLTWRARLKPGDYEVQLAVPYAYALYGIALAILLWNWSADRRSAPPSHDAGVRAPA